METGAMIGGGLFLTLVFIGIFMSPCTARFDYLKIAAHGLIFTGVGAFWGWAVEAVL